MTGKATRLCIVLLAGGLWLSGGNRVGAALASDLEVKPALSVSEQYDDNIFETADGRRTEFTTMVRPGASLNYRASQLQLDGSYVFEYRNYAKGTHDDQEIHNLNLSAKAELAGHFLYLEVGEVMHRTMLNVARDVASESLLSQQSEQNVAFVSPYLLWRLGEQATVKTGYRFTDTRYWDGLGLDQQAHSALAEFQQQLSDRLSLHAGYTFTRGLNSALDYDRHDVSGGFKYNYAGKGMLFGSIGNSWQSFSAANRTSNLYWDAGINHDFGSAIGVLETKAEDVADPLTISTRQVSYLGRVDKQFARGGCSLSGSYWLYYITQSDRLEQRRVNGAGVVHYDLRPRLTATASAAVDRFSQTTSADYPYRLTGSLGINCGLYNADSALSLVYTYVNDRYHLGSAAGQKVANRLLLEVRALF